jgi:UDP-2,3-diacylglucosamine pyrophosphatase LpxH
MLVARMEKRLRTGWISDVHLGTRGAQTAKLLHFLKTHEFETLYIVGDLLDVWSLRRGIYWPQSHNDVIQKILRAARKGTRVIYIPGNHDEFVSDYHGEFGGITIQPNAIHTTADGRRLLVMHGHELDAVVKGARWLALIGDIGYQFLLKCNRPVNWARRLFGMGYWSLSAFAKKKVKSAVNYVGKFEEGIVRFANEAKTEGVVCGHIHVPTIRDLNGTTYFNCGDWVESCSALVEHPDGRIELLVEQHDPDLIIPLPMPPTVSMREFEEIGRRMA